MATDCKDYDFSRIEPHWQSFWEESGAFRARTGSARPKYYVLDMFPYPSGSGLHMGHCENYAITDIVARWRRARGFNVLYPIGWDAFGLPTENYAVKTGRHPADVTRENIATFRRQLKSYGLSYDFEREIDTSDPDYFRWTQWIWLQLFRCGLAFVDEKPVWWCPALGTVLANEEVTDGKSEIGGHPVERRPLRQWVLRITAYAERLLAGLDRLDWPESTKRMQAAWIGRSEGSEVDFDIEGLPGERLRVFTTRVDTLFGATYMVVAPEHPLVDRLTTPDRRDAVRAYVRAAASKSDIERTDLAKEKSGEFTGSFAVNPANGSRIPIWVADYVLVSYGTGAIMAVPGHDERDFEFAERFRLPVIRVIGPADGSSPQLPFVDKGEDVRLLNSGDCDGLTPSQAKRKLDARFESDRRGRSAVQYKLRDWLFSRQRYWGEPFPIVWVSEEDYRSAVSASGQDLPLPPEPVSCLVDGALRYALPLPEKSLPLRLPEVKSYQPTGTGESPLALITDWLEIWYQPRTGDSVPASRPKPGADWIRARRETNTMPQWAGSCWYYLRYLDPSNPSSIASKEALDYWGMPDIYVGGTEHAVLHLLYSRFWHMVLHDIGVVQAGEPFQRLFHQGIILGEDGEKMSKSRGNVANPESIIESHGVDTLRLYLMFLGPPEASKPWNPRGIEGVHRFLHKVWRECIGEDGRVTPKLSEGAAESPELRKLLHQTIRKVGEDISNLHLNTAISQMMIFVNALQKAPATRPATALTFLKLLAPFAPHIAEELWGRIGGEGSVGQAPWPDFEERFLVSSELKLVMQVNGKHRGDQLVRVDLSKEEAVEIAKAHPKVAPLISGKVVKRVVYVPNKIINIVLQMD